MEYLTLSLLGIAGVLLHILMKFRDSISKEPADGRKFKARLQAVWTEFDLLGNLAYGLFAVVLVLILVGIREQITAVLPITKISILFVGYAADSAFKNLKPEGVK